MPVDNVISLLPRRWGIPFNVKVEDKVTTLTKPKMRGLLNASITRTVTEAFILAALGGYAFKVLVADERKRKYAEFYRNYDAEKVFEDMRKKRVFQSC